jgi:predicted TIM-barrel fold metal-dependent hydrolase
MSTKTFPIFDCDSHIVEPPAIWDEYVPSGVRAWVKTQFHFHTDTDVLLINGRAVPASRERANAAEVGWPGWKKKEVGVLTPGTEAWKAKFGRLAGCRDPRARLADMDALGVDQVMLFPSWFVRLPLVRDPVAARILATAYNDWVDDYASADRRRLFPCAMLPIQSVEDSIAELRRVARKGFKAAAVRPCFCNGRYPTLPEFDPLWREFEALDVVLAMHTFPSREALTPEWADRIARTRGKRAAVHRRGGGVLTGAVREQHRLQHGADHRCQRVARLHLRGDDLAHDRAHDRLAREVPPAQVRGAGVERHPAAARPGPEPELPRPLRVPAGTEDRRPPRDVLPPLFHRLRG